MLNGTGRAGLASTVAAHLRSLGWKVVRVGNYRARVTATRAYVLDQPAAGATMVQDVTSATLVKQLLRGMRTGDLTLVIGTDYTG